MPSSNARARRQLDQRLAALRPLLEQPRPHRGWVRAIRDALGMSSTELAARLGVSQATVAGIERNEQADRIQLDTLRRAADAMDCELVYALVPRTSLEEAVQAQAEAKARRHLGQVGHHSRLEDQAIPDEAARAQLDDLVERLIDKRGLWSSAS